MSNRKRTHAKGLIESAMDRIAVEAAVPDEATANLRQVAARTYDDGAARPTGSAPAGQDLPHIAPLAPEIRSEPHASNRSESHEAGRRRGYGPGAIVLAVGVAALAGAGLTWLAVGGAVRGSIPAPALPAVPAAPTAASAAPAATTVPVPAAAAPLTKPALPVDDSEQQVRDLVERWRRTWANKDIEPYLALYGAEFVSADGRTRSNWAEARRRYLSRQSEISVRVHDLRIERIDKNRLKVMFLQDYASGGYREVAQPKNLLLVRAGSDWRIAAEWQGPQAPPVARK